MDIAKAVEFFQGDSKCEWSIGETYESLDWKESNVLPKPTQSELTVAWNKYKTERERYKFKKDRALELPTAEEQLRIIFSEGLDEWSKRIKAIIDKHPAPEGAVDNYKSTAGNPMNELKNKVNTIESTVNTLKDNRESEIKVMSQAMSDISAGFFAVKGFMMMLPDLKKTLDEINAKLTPADE